MKTLRKISLDGFDRLSITEASRLFGGNGDNPPTTSTVPNDSIGSNRNDSIPPTPKFVPTNTVTGGTKMEKDKSWSFTGSYERKESPTISWNVTVDYNTQKGVSIGAGGKITF